MFSWYDEVQKIKSWIDRNIEQDISLSQLSKFCGISLLGFPKIGKDSGNRKRHDLAAANPGW